MEASLCPPANRHRASSTNVRPALTLNSCGSRRRSNSLLDLPPPTASPCPTPRADMSMLSLSNDMQSESALTTLASRLLHLLHMDHKHQSFPPSPVSPPLSRTSLSAEETILPLSASSTQTTFGDIYSEKPLPKSQPWWHTLASVHTPVLFVVILLPLSTALVLLFASTLPITMSWPRNLTDLAQLGRELHGYSQSGPGPQAHVIAVMSAMAVWKHAWSIPGSVIWNVLAGALFSPAYATLLLTVLTTIGSVSASLLAAPLAPFLVRIFPRALAMTRSALEGDSSSEKSSLSSKPRSPPWVRLSILRLIGIIPWSGINIACGVCGVAISDCFLGAFIGSLPWTAVTCQIGDILQTVASNPTPRQQTVQSLLASPEIMFKLIFLSFLSLAPILGRDYLRAWIASSTLPDSRMSGIEDERGSRWTWAKEWGHRIRMPSQSRAREALKKELEVLTQEKNQRLPL